MQADSMAGRVIGALGRTPGQAPSQDGIGLSRSSAPGRVIGALARTEIAPPDPTSPSEMTDARDQHADHLAEELQYGATKSGSKLRWRLWEVGGFWDFIKEIIGYIT